MKDDVCMKFYNETKPLYLETDASGIGLITTLLQTIDGMTCPRDTAPQNTILEPITSASVEWRYSNIFGYIAWSWKNFTIITFLWR